MEIDIDYIENIFFFFFFFNYHDVFRYDQTTSWNFFPSNFHEFFTPNSWQIHLCNIKSLLFNFWLKRYICIHVYFIMHNKEGDISISIRLHHFFPFSRWWWPISPNFIKLGFRSWSCPPSPSLPFSEDRKSGSFAA